MQLIFKVDGVDVTQQSVKDTQTRIDEKLGVGNGLLQRCCFFGQHSHTMQALLGLTDIKLKNELSLMVDMSLWIAAVQDVKAREKTCKGRASEISVELRIRKDEHIRESDALLGISTALERMKAEEASLGEALNRLLHPRDVNSSALSADQISVRIADLERETADFRTNVVDVFRNTAEAEIRQEMEEMHTLDLKLSESKQSLAKLEFVMQSSLNSMNASESKARQLQSQINHLNAQLAQLCSDETVALHLDDLKASIQVQNVQLAEYDVRITNAEEALKLLKDFGEKCSHGNNSARALSSSLSCPTCGQEYREDSAASRMIALNNDLKRFLSEREIVDDSRKRAIKLHDNTLQATSILERIQGLQVAHEEICEDLKKEEAVVQKLKVERKAVDDKISMLNSDRRAAEERRRTKEIAREAAKRESEAKLSAMSAELERLRGDLVPVSYITFAIYINKSNLP